MHLCLTSVSPYVYLAFLLPLCAIHTIHLCLTSMPDPPSTPFPYHMRAAHLICACTLSLSPTRFRSQLYISHNTCTQVENKTIFVIRDFIQSADLCSAAYYNWRSRCSDCRPKLSTIWLRDGWYFQTPQVGMRVGTLRKCRGVKYLGRRAETQVAQCAYDRSRTNSISAFVRRCTRRLREG